MTQHLLEKASVSAELKEPYFEANILLIGLQIQQQSNSGQRMPWFMQNLNGNINFRIEDLY